MSTNNSSNNSAALHRLKAEIDRLNVLQTHALRMATVGGMTLEDAQQYDERRGRITQLVRELAAMDKPRP